MPVIHCHNCAAQFSVPSNTGECPRCGGGFVEEVAAAPQAAPSNNGRTFSRTYTTPGGGLSFQIVTSTGGGGSGGMPPGFPGFPGGGGGDPMIQSILDIMARSGLMHPMAGGAPFPMPPHGGAASEQEWLDGMVTQLMNEYVPPTQATSERALRSLPTLKVRAAAATGEPGEGEAICKAGEPCSVCHDEFEAGEDVLELPCGHDYHTECLTPWLETHNTCPVCRHELPAADPAVEAERRRRQEGGSSRTRPVGPSGPRPLGDDNPLSNLLNSISARWESFRGQGEHGDGQRAGGHAQQAAAHAGQAAAAGAAATAAAGGSSRQAASSNGAAGASSSAHYAATASGGASGSSMRQRREAAAAAAERRLHGDTAAPAPSQAQQSPHPPAAPRPAQAQRPPTLADSEGEDGDQDGVLAGAIAGGVLGAMLGGAFVLGRALLGGGRQRDRQ